jgi:amino acid adenylation domain-containing protein
MEPSATKKAAEAKKATEIVTESVFAFPMSFAQQRLWFLDQFEPGNPIYNIAWAIRLQGQLDVPALERSLNEIMRRHEVLRATFTSINDQPVQVIAPAVTIKLDITDLSTLPGAEREIHLRKEIQEQAERPMDLQKGPLFGARLLRLDAEDHVALLSIHHIIFDRWSRGIFFRELTALYSAFTRGESNPLRELPLQFTDYAVWQRQFLQGKNLEKQLSYWKQQLGDAPASLELPTDRPRPAVQTFRGKIHTLQISAAVTEGLKGLSRQEGATLFMTLLAGFQLLLARYSGQDDVVVGTPIANRNRAEVENLIGFFANTLALRTNLAGDPTFRELLGRVREVALGAYAHQDLPFEKLVEELRPERSLSHSPIFQVLFALQNAPTQDLKLPGLTLSSLPITGEKARFDISLFVAETSQGLLGRLEYNTDLFDESTIERMATHFVTVLQSVIAEPEQRVCDVPLLTPAERKHVLVDWNATFADYAKDRCIHQLFEEQVAKTPNGIAVTFEDQSLSYAELNGRANQLARYLQKRGVGPDVLVGFCVERSLEMVVGLLGILKAGGAYVPLDPAYPQERIAYILENAHAPVLVTQESLRAGLLAKGAEVVPLDADWNKIAQESSENVSSYASASNLAYAIYTSGSTGKPKGVEIEHSAVVNFLSSMRREPGLTADDSLLAVTTLSFDIAGLEIYLPLTTGARVVVASRDEVADGHKLLARMQSERITVMQATPATWRLLLSAGWTGGKDLKLLCGGEALPRELAEQLLPQCASLWNMYGPTETTIWSAVEKVTAADQAVVSIGRPIANTEIYILDAKQQPLPVGVAGELYIGGDGLARGYVGRPDLTAEKFVPHPFRSGARVYRTGDLARYLADGRVMYLGRSDYQVKVRGFRIELGEIEAALAQHPAVKQAVAAVRDDASGEKRLVAYLIPRTSHPIISAELRSFLKQSLPDYMVPPVFMALEQFPLTPNGKVDRKALPAPEVQTIATSETYVAPRNPVEEALAGIWEEVLHGEQVGAHDNFFELGGHSLLATQVISRVRQTFQTEIPLRALFEAPTVAGLAERIASARREAKGLETTPVVPVARVQDLPLSFSQQRLWFLDQLKPNNPVYNIPWALRLTGMLNADVLHRSLNEIVRRHEVLRTRFASVEDRPVQVIAPDLRLDLPITDLSERTDADADAQRLVNVEAMRPFDLAQGPLVRASLLRLSEQEHVLVLNVHHIVSDRWSSGVLLRELTALYRAFVESKPSPLSELPIQYADYAAWQRNNLQGEHIERLISFWKERLAGAPPMLELPTDRPRPPVESFRGANSLRLFPKTLADKLKSLSRQHGTTLFMTVLAAFQVLLARYSGQEDIVVGSPIANRNRAEIENLIGFFVNTLVLRTDLSGNPTFRELLERVKEVSLEAYAHQDLPFEKLVEELQPERTLSHSPLFQVVFALQNTPVELPDLPGLKLGSMPTATGTAKTDLVLYMTEVRDGLLGRMEYNSDLFDEHTIASMLEHLEVLLDGVVADPEKAISDLPFLTSYERKKLLHDWNQTDAEFPSSLCFHQLLQQQVERTPEAVALEYCNEQLTYAELNSRANQLANRLRTMGVGPDAPVAICIERSPEMVVGLLGIVKAGGAYVPLDPTYPADRLAFMLGDTKAPVLLTQSKFIASLPTAEAKVLAIDTEWASIAAESTEAPKGDTRPENLVYIIYTSGSTGKPKGTMITHRGLVNYLTWATKNYRVSEGDGSLVHSPLGFDLTVTSLLAPLVVGQKAVLLAESEGIAGLTDALNEAKDYSLVKITPAHLEVLGQKLDSRTAPKQARCLVIGGEQLLANTLDFWREHAPKTRIINEYGPTETVVGCCVYEVAEGETLRPGAVPIGRPIANTQLYILDRHLNPVPIGVPGELYIGGAGVARGYLNRPELTAEKFIRDPFSKHANARLYKTGDLARYLPDGDLEYLGRTDDQIKLRGFRIELGEIEAVLAQHPAVREAAVIVREDQPGDKRLVAYVAAVVGQDPSTAEIRNFAAEKLPAHMVPAAIVKLPELPLTPNGKVDRRALPAPDQSRPELEESYVGPRTPIEEGVAGIWAQVLKIERVGVYDNFFQLGGHSLLATQVISRIRQVFQVELPLRAIFESPTVAGLSELVDKEKRAQHGLQFPPIIPAPRTGELPLSFAQQRLWFLDQLQPDNSFYNVPWSLRINGPLKVDVLQKTLDEIAARHEVLRTTFTKIDNQPVQVIAPILHVELSTQDLSALPGNQHEAEARRLATEEAQRPFDLATGPLFRAGLLRLGDEDHVLLLNIHHIASDGWSVALLIKELAVLYDAFAAGKPSPLPPLPIQYADYAVWQRQWLQGETLHKQLDYWRNQLSDAPPVLDLPTDHPRPALESFRGTTETFQISQEIAQGLRELNRREGTTLFMTLLAAFQVLLSRYTRQEDIVVGSPIANRNHAEIENLIGFFVNTLVFRTDLSGNPTFRELLGRVKETALAGYAHQDLPFEKLVEEVQPERSLGHNPLFQVLFAVQNAPRQALKLADLNIRTLEVSRGSSKFDMTLFVTERSEGLTCIFEYNTDLFEAATIRRIIGHFQQLVEGIVTNPDRPLADYELLQEEERRRVLVEWNQNSKDYPARCIHEFFEDQVKKTPNETALIAGEERLSYAELNRRSNQLAHYLRRLGVGPEILVGICMERSTEMLVGILGILKAGGAYVPLDPAYPKDRIAFALQDCQAPVLLTQERLQQTLPENSAKLVRIDADWSEISKEDAGNLSPAATPNHLAYLIYTSGSTGRPKGVAIEHLSTSTFIQWSQSIFSRDELAGVLLSTSICFDLSVFEMFVPLSVGGKIILAQNALELPSLLAAHEVTLINTVPSAIAELLRMEGVPNSVTVVNLAGEPLPRSLAKQIYAKETIRKVYNLYGPTEDTTYSTFTLVPNDDTRVTIGRPIINTQAYVVDAQMRPVPVGVPGELLLGGEGLARGYFGRPDLTEQKFIPNPFSQESGSRLYRTGDLARYLPDGNLLFLGRIDHQVKVRGFRIELGEIESVLTQHAAVRQSLVMVREDDPGNKQIVAYVMPNSNFRGDAASESKEQDRAQVEQWETAWNETYKQKAAASDSTFNVVGWNSSYTGLPIPPEEMREWVDNTVDRILSLRPNRILELGCGTGLLMFRLASNCSHYHASDFSNTAIEYLQEQLAKQQNKLPVALSCRMADDFSGLQAGSFDTVVLNSVAQYFPSADYFVKVVERAVEMVQPGGAIFLGDLRSFALLEAFHTAVQLHQAPASMSCNDLLQKVRRRIAQEEELTIDPALFTALQQRIPKISSVEILLKRGRYHNEMSQFRYDVILRVGATPVPRQECAWLDWQKQDLTPAAVVEILKKTAPSMLGITGVPNARVWAAAEALRQLSQGEAPSTVGELRNHLKDVTTHVVEPDDLWSVGEDAPYSVSIRWSVHSGHCDVVFCRNGTPWAMPVVAGEKSTRRPLHTYANDPLQGIAARTLVPELRKWLNERVPDYMIPSAFVVLDSFPLTPNGKINRRALPAPDALRQGKAVPPRNEVERTLVEIWQQLLGIQSIGVKDNFFDLGGHSLLAVRLMAEIQRATGKQIPLATLFQGATVEYLASLVQQDAKVADEMVVEIQRGGSKPPFFGIVTPGVNALGYVALARHLGEDQPLYRVQGPGPRITERPYTAAEFNDLALRYIKAMKTVQPEGPYYLGGMCEGARIAFDMARNLEARGDKVALLAILDTWVIENSQNRLLWYVAYYRQRWRTLQALSAGQKWAVMRRSLGSTAKRVFGVGRTTKSLWPQAYWPGKDFVPAKYGGKITLFRIPKQPFYYVRDPLMGWGMRTTGEVELRTVSGRHNFILREPYVQSLAKELRATLNQLRSRDSEQAGASPYSASSPSHAKSGNTSSGVELRLPGIEAETASSSSELGALLMKQVLSGKDGKPEKSGASFPMSAQQQRLWVLDQLEHSDSAHIQLQFLQLKGDLDRDALEKALDALVARHKILRSQFLVKDGEPLQIVGEAYRVATDFVDLMNLPDSDRRKQARSLSLEEVRRPFDLQGGQLLRALVMRLNKDEYVLALITHRIGCDSKSSGILQTELASLYSAFKEGSEPNLPELTAQYSDFALWQKQCHARHVFDADLDYWKQQLAGAEGLELPADRPRPAVQTFRGARQSLIVDREILARLRDLSRRERVPLFVTLCSVFASLLARYSGREDIVLGSEVSGRAHPELEGLIGLFCNELVIRADVSGNPNFRELLKRLKNVWDAAQKHQALPFGTLVENLNLQRDMSRNPLFQVMIALQDAPDTLVGRDLRFTPLSTETGTETLDLSVSLIEHGERLEARFSYNTDLFFDATIERMIGHFRMLLEAVAINPERKLSELPLLTPAERHQILVEWNDTRVEYPRDLPLNRFVEDQVGRTPDAIAVIFGSEKLTYRELNARANQLAHHLRRLGVGPDVLVGVCAERSLEMVIALHGIVKAGGAYVPLDPEYPKERIEAMLDDAKPAAVLIQERFLDCIPSGTQNVICLDRDWPLIAGEPSSDLPVVARGKNLAYAIYTSGSTGRPKGVPNVHEGIVNRLLWMQDRYKLTAADRVLQKTPFSFDVSVWEFFWPLMTGATLVVASPHGHKDPAYLVNVIIEQKITTLHFVPSMLAIFLEADGVDRCSSLRQVFASGEALPYDLQERFFQRVKAQLHNLYGPTEAAVDVTYWQCRSDGDQSIVPIGRPIANTQIYILDSNLQPVPTGVAGELHIGGVGLARGYLNRPDLTAEKFIRNPFIPEPGARLYKTGDLARFLPDGNIEYLGRIDHQIKLRGFRIELGEIEAVLAEDSSVRQAVVTVRENSLGDQRLVAYLVASAGQNLDLDALRNRAKAKLPEFMVPSKFVLLEKFPMTTSGKVDRRALPTPAPEHRDGSSMVAPRNRLEAMLVSIFQQILGLQQVGVTDDFFNLGGHSLQAARLVGEIHQATRKQIPLSLLFRGATAEYLARVIQQGIDLPPEPVVMSIQTGESGPVFFAVVPPGENAVGYAKLARHMGANQRFYKLQGPGAVLVGRPYTNEEMQALADEYVEAMRSLQPRGPYYFGGMCDGAHIALRMARRLDQVGEKVGMLAVFDTWVLENSQRLLPWYIHYYSQRFQEFRKLGIGRQFKVASGTLRNLVNKILRRSPKRSLWSEAYWPDENFVAPTFSGPVTLFKRPKQPYYYVRDPKMGWAARALGGVDVQVLPILHDEMLHDPNVRILGERLAECLRTKYLVLTQQAGGKENGVAISVGTETESEVS